MYIKKEMLKPKQLVYSISLLRLGPLIIKGIGNGALLSFTDGIYMNIRIGILSIVSPGKLRYLIR